MDYKEYFKNKKVTLMGLGLLGRGVNDALFLLKNGVELTITDLRNEKELAPSLEKLKEFEKIKYTLGEHKLEDFQDKDFILKAAGVPMDSSFIAHAREKGIPIEMDASLFFKLAPEVVAIGVTGTRGKSTVTKLIYEIIKARYGEGKVHLGGNVRDMATLPLLEKVKAGDFVVLELDSWQLQGFGESRISPHIAVFTNLMDDHLNYYKNDLEMYFEDKANIFKFQKQNDYLVTGEKIAHLITAKYFGKLFNAPLSIGGGSVPKDWDIKIPGDHNLDNIALAIKVGKILGISYEIIKEAVENFHGVEGRLQFVKEVRGVKIWNDNNATTPEATIVAIKALCLELKASDKKIVLICGGADKGLELSGLVEEINKTCKEVVLLSGSGTEKLKAESPKIQSSIVEVNNLEEAVKVALGHCSPGDELLFSPGFASFGLFKNEYDRNDQFIELVSRL